MRNRTLLATATVGLLLAPAGTAYSATPTCDGLTATIVSGKRVVRGTSGNDVIVVTGSRSHKVYGLGGNDVICGSPGNDVINGGSGNDTLFGMRGKDKLFGKSGADALSGGTGKDALYGGTGKDDLDGNDRGDTLAGGPAADVLHTDPADVVLGASGDDEQDDSEWLSLTAGEQDLRTVLQTAGQALYDGLTAVPPTVTGTGNQTVLPVDATVAPYSLSTEQVAMIANVTWRATSVGDEEDDSEGPRGCVDGVAADSGRSFKVRIESRDGHDSEDGETTGGPELKFTLGTCEFTWDHDGEGVNVPTAVASALATASGVSSEHQSTADSATSLAGYLLGDTVTGSGDVSPTTSVTPGSQEETVQSLLGTGTGFDLRQIMWSSQTPDLSGQFEAHACLVADDTTQSPVVTYHQSIEVQRELHDGILVTKVEMHYLLGDCAMGGNS
jgi:hypothetical protein